MTSDRDCWVKYMAVSDEGAVQNLFMLQRLIEMVKVRKLSRWGISRKRIMVE